MRIVKSIAYLGNGISLVYCYDDKTYEVSDEDLCGCGIDIDSAKEDYLNKLRESLDEAIKDL